MSDGPAPSPRSRRNEHAPPSALDPFVLQLLRWLAGQEKGANPNTMARHAAAALDWPLPFAEAIVTAARGRRLLTMLPFTVRGGDRAGVGERGMAWLARAGESDAAERTDSDSQERDGGAGGVALE